MKVVPLDDKVVIKRLESEEMTAGGILLPDQRGRNRNRDAFYRSATGGCLLRAAGFPIRSVRGIESSFNAGPAPRW